VGSGAAGSSEPGISDFDLLFVYLYTTLCLVTDLDNLERRHHKGPGNGIPAHLLKLVCKKRYQRIGREELPGSLPLVLSKSLTSYVDGADPPGRGIVIQITLPLLIPKKERHFEFPASFFPSKYKRILLGRTIPNFAVISFARSLGV
jgi:hypothetical protein